MLHLFLAEGFEEIEALTTLDILRRCGIEVTTVSITGKRLIHGAHDIPIMADSLFRRSAIEKSEGLILPGGMPGAKNLMIYDGLRKALIGHDKQGKLIAAICAAPSVLAALGLLEGKNATAHAGFQDQLAGAIVHDEEVVVDGNLTTSYGLGGAIPFALELVRQLAGKEEADRIQNAIAYRHSVLG